MCVRVNTKTQRNKRSHLCHDDTYHLVASDSQKLVAQASDCCHPVAGQVYTTHTLTLCSCCHSCTLEPKFIELGLVPFGMPKAFSVRLENVGTTPARFYFVAPPKLLESRDGVMVWDDNQPLCPPWLLIGQEDGELEPGAVGLLMYCIVCTTEVLLCCSILRSEAGVHQSVLASALFEYLPAACRVSF